MHYGPSGKYDCADSRGHYEEIWEVSPPPKAAPFYPQHTNRNSNTGSHRAVWQMWVKRHQDKAQATLDILPIEVINHAKSTATFYRIRLRSYCLDVY